MKARLNAITTAFEQLSTREQSMVLFVIIGFLTMAVGGGGYLVSRDLTSRRARIESKLEKLTEIASLRTDYQKRLEEQNRLSTEVKSNQSMRILSYLEEQSKKANVELSNAAERSGESTGSEQVKEEAAEVMVKNVSLDRLFEFLKQIEEGNRLVKIRQLKIRTRFDNAQMLDASITVGTYKPTGTT